MRTTVFIVEPSFKFPPATTYFAAYLPDFKKDPPLAKLCRIGSRSVESEDSFWGAEVN